METKKQRIERLRQMRKKYGLGEFKKGFNSVRRQKQSIKFKRGLKIMAKKRRKSYSGSSSGVGNLMGTAAGVGAYILFETLLEPKIAGYIGNGLMLNVAELAAGVYLAKKGGVIGNVGKAAIVINTYQILQPMLAGIAGNAQ